jgi:hypothetical protein
MSPSREPILAPGCSDPVGSHRHRGWSAAALLLLLLLPLLLVRGLHIVKMSDLKDQLLRAAFGRIRGNEKPHEMKLKSKGYA